MSSSNLVRITAIEESTYGVTPGTKAVLVVQDLTYLADLFSESGNLISIAYTGGATAGAEVVTVIGNAISVQIETGVSTATQVKAAVDASGSASALISVTISGTGSNTQVTVGAAFLAGGIGDFNTARFTSEGFSGSPDTTQSALIRTDRMSSGQVVTGLKVSGELQTELAKDTLTDLFLKSAMHNTWNTASPVTIALTIVTSTKTISRPSGSFVSEGVVVGDFISLSGFTTPANNTQVMVKSVATLSITYVGPDTIVDEVGAGASYDRADKLTIGQTKKSFSIEKAFLDLTTKALIYKGMAVDTFSLSVNYGEIVKATFGFVGNNYINADTSGEFITNGRTILAQDTTNSLNGSIDMPFLASSDTGALLPVGFCIQSVELNLNNNLQPQNCIGETAPVDYSSGTAQIEISLNAYLSNDNWNLLPKKLDQSSFALGFMVKNAGGWYGVYIPAIQISMDDPSSAGQNQQISLSMKGQAKAGSSGESAIIIYRGV